MSEPVSLSELQFLAWVASRPRTYGEVRQAWRSTCPRLALWEDAIEAGLVELGDRGRANDRSSVILTPRGRAALADAAVAGRAG